MADAITNATIFENRERVIKHFTNISDGTGESNAVKFDKSALIASDGAEPASLEIEKIQYCTDGMQVQVYFNHGINHTAAILSGSGVLDFTSEGGKFGGVAGGSLADPGTSNGGSGDIVFTTLNHTSGDAYSVTMWVKKKPD